MPLGNVTLGFVELASTRKFSSASQQISSLIGTSSHNRDPIPPATVLAAKIKVDEVGEKSKQPKLSEESGEKWNS